MLKKQIKRGIKSALILSIAIKLGACSQTINDYCLLYAPVPTLQQGSDVQKLLTDENNAIYYERCM